MKYIISLAMLCVLTIAHAQNQKYPHRYTVSLQKGYNKLETPSEFTNQSLLKNMNPINSYGNILAIEFNGKLSSEEEIKWLRQNPSIAYFQAVSALEKRNFNPKTCNPNDSYYLSQYDMSLMKFNEAWCFKNEGVSPLGDTLVVGEIDYGFNFENADLIPNIFINHLEIPDNGIDDDQNGYTDDYYGLNAMSAKEGDDHITNDDHGTQVLSVIGAKGNNKLDISGTNQNIKMLLCSASTDQQLVKCYHYFVAMKRDYLNSGGKRGAFIVSTNLSAGFKDVFPKDYPLICQAYDSLGEVGILTSVATINYDLDIDVAGDIPGTCTSDYLLVTTNTDRYDQKVEAGYSQKSVDLGACGEDIPMIDSQGNVNNASGTSFASPHVAGAISLLYQFCPKLSSLNKTNPPAAARMVKEFILKCGDDLPSLSGITTTGKRLNMIKSLQCLNSYCNDDTLSLKCRILLKNNLHDEPIEISFHPEAFGDYNLFVYNNLGQIIHSEILNFSPDKVNQHLIKIYYWTTGIYHVVIDGQGFRCAESLIKL